MEIPRIVLFTLVLYLFIGHVLCQEKRYYTGKRIGGGATYIRWGRTTCPYTVKTVYSGYTAGSHFMHVGGTVDYLCLPKSPRYGFSRVHSDWRSPLYGTQYETGTRGGSPFKTPNLHNQDVPCALCLVVKSRSTAVVFPAHVQCPYGWTFEYKGYMMSEHSGHNSPRRAVCVDERPEKIPWGNGERNEALMYPMTTKCGILPCPPFANRELNCVVCTI